MKKLLATTLCGRALTGAVQTAEARYVLQPLPRNIERIRSRLWTAVRTGT